MTGRQHVFTAVVAAGLAGAGALLVAGMLLHEAAPSQSSGAGELIQTSAVGLGTVGAIAPLLQLRRIVATQSARDVSLLFLLLWTGTCVTGILMGTMLRAPGIWIPNLFGLVATGTTLACAARMRWTWRHYDALQAIQVQDAAAGAVVRSETAAGSDPVPLAPGHERAEDALAATEVHLDVAAIAGGDDAPGLAPGHTPARPDAGMLRPAGP